MEIIVIVMFLAWFTGMVGYARQHFARERPLLEPNAKHNQMDAHSCKEKRCFERNKDGYLTERACITGGLLVGAAWPFWVPVVLTAKGLRTAVTAQQPGLKAERAEVARKDMLALTSQVTPETIKVAEEEFERAGEELERAKAYVDDDTVYTGTTVTLRPGKRRYSR